MKIYIACPNCFGTDLEIDDKRSDKTKKDCFKCLNPKCKSKFTHEQSSFVK